MTPASFVIYFPDTKDCNDFIASLENNNLNYCLIGKDKSKNSVKYNNAFLALWLKEDLFTEVYLMHIIDGIIKMFPAGSTFRLIGFHEREIGLQGYLVDQLSISGIPTRLTDYFGDKLQMISKASQLDIYIPRTYKMTDIDLFFHEYNSTNGYIIKPRNGFGSKGIIKCQSKVQCYKWYDDNIDRASEYVIQEFINGEVYHIDSVIIDNVTQIYFCGRNLTSHISIGKSPNSFKRNLVIANSSPIAKSLYALYEKIRIHFGIEYGCTNMEFFVEESGRIVFCEVAARPSGGGIQKLHKILYGKSLVEIFADCLANVKVNLPSHQEENCVSGVICFVPEAPIIECTNISDFNFDWIVERSQIADLAKVIGGSYHSEIGRIYIKAQNEEECEQRLNLLAESFKYTLSTISTT